MRGQAGVLHHDVWKTDAFYGPNGDPYGFVLDFQLRPIRDPGDDAQDETLDWLPVPTKELA
jgi:hypothetical protein